MTVDQYEAAVRPLAELPSSPPPPERFSRRRRRHRALSGLGVVVLLGCAALGAAVALSGGPPRDTVAASGGGAAAPTAMVLRVGAEAQEVTGGLQVEPLAETLGPAAPSTYGFQVTLRATADVYVAWTAVHGPEGVVPMLCGEVDTPCDEPDRSADGDGWTLAAGDTMEVAFFVDTDALQPGRSTLRATLEVAGEAVEFPVSLSAEATDEPAVVGPGLEPVIEAEGGN